MCFVDSKQYFFITLQSIINNKNNILYYYYYNYLQSHKKRLKGYQSSHSPKKVAENVPSVGCVQQAIDMIPFPTYYIAVHLVCWCHSPKHPRLSLLSTLPPFIVRGYLCLSIYRNPLPPKHVLNLNRSFIYLNTYNQCCNKGNVILLTANKHQTFTSSNWITQNFLLSKLLKDN